MHMAKATTSAKSNRPVGKAILLLSGGPDSATLLAWAAKEGYDITCLNFQFGLRTDPHELRAARAVAKHFGKAVDIIDLSEPTAMLGGLRHTIHSEAHVLRFGTSTLMSMASCYAILKSANHVLVALHADDSDESPEYTQAFLDSIQASLKIARSGVDDIALTAPFIKMRKTEELKLGKSLGVPFELTWSCLVGSKVHCGGCGACRARMDGFAAAGIEDKTKYKA
jgi:7-cyano-7-deazaguanine synthase